MFLNRVTSALYIITQEIYCPDIILTDRDFPTLLCEIIAIRKLFGIANN